MMDKDHRQELLNQLKLMSETDIRTVDPNTLVDISNVTIRSDLPQPERVRDYMEQVRNPYCFLCHGMVVKISFAGKKRFEDCLKDATIV